MNTLEVLIADATALANPDETLHGGRLWRSIGGRACPIGWHNCSQPVFEDIRTGEVDYGERGGPGHADCVKHCREAMKPPPPPEPDPPLHALEGTNFRAAARLFHAWSHQ